MTEAQAPTTGLTVRRIGIITATAVGSALITNVLLWLVGLLLGGTFEAPDGSGGTDSAAPGGVIVMTVLPLAVGLLVAGLIATRWSPVIRVAQVIGSIAALGTIFATVAAGFDTVSMVMLSLMHVVLVPVLVYALERMRG